MVAPDDCAQLHGSDVGRWQAHGAVSGSAHWPMVRADALMYAELHCHSAYSFLDGASPPDEILAEAHRLGYPTLALTDRTGIYGSLTFAHAAKPLGLQAITGAEVTLTDGSHLILLAETPQGYTNLCRLRTEAHLGAGRLKPRLPRAAIESRHAGLIVLSGSRREGLLSRTLATEGLGAARTLARHCKDVFGRDRFFVEIQRNRVRGDSAEYILAMPGE